MGMPMLRWLATSAALGTLGYYGVVSPWWVAGLIAVAGIYEFFQSVGDQVKREPSAGVALGPHEHAVGPPDVIQVSDGDHRLTLVGQMVVSDHDRPIADLNKEATAAAAAKEWDQAITALKAAQALMRHSSGFPAESWCRLGLYLQRAGRYEEAMAEFDSLIERLPDIVRREVGEDDPNSGRTPADRRKLYAILMEDYTEVVLNKRELIEERERKARDKAEKASQPKRPRKSEGAAP